MSTLIEVSFLYKICIVNPVKPKLLKQCYLWLPVVVQRNVFKGFDHQFIIPLLRNNEAIDINIDINIYAHADTLTLKVS